MADFQDAFEVEQKLCSVDGEKEDVVDDGAVASVFCIGVTRLEECVPFGGDNMYHAGVEAWCIAGAEEHGLKGVFGVVGGKVC